MIKKKKPVELLASTICPSAANERNRWSLDIPLHQTPGENPSVLLRWSLLSKLQNPMFFVVFIHLNAQSFRKAMSAICLQCLRFFILKSPFWDESGAPGRIIIINVCMFVRVRGRIALEKAGKPYQQGNIPHFFDGTKNILKKIYSYQDLSSQSFIYWKRILLPGRDESAHIWYTLYKLLKGCNAPGKKLRNGIKTIIFKVDKDYW